MASPLARLLLVALAAAWGAAVGGNGGDASDVAVHLRPESDLTSHCFDFPAQNFDRRRSIYGVYGQSPNLLLEKGSGAIDFTLHDYPGGNTWNLRDQLEEGRKPVVLIWGMYTCPAFQGMGDKPPIPPWDMCSYWDEYKLVEQYNDRVTFAHLYGPEPHPAVPGTNFDHGIGIDSYWSTVQQPSSYAERLANVERVKSMIHPQQVILPDYLPGNPYSKLVQPVWCSYGLGARPAMAISPDGSVFFQQEWLNTGHMAHELDVFLRGDGAAFAPSE